MNIQRVRSDLVDNIALFLAPHAGGEEQADETAANTPFDRYEVNLLVSQPEDGGAPVVEEVGGPSTRVYSYPTAPGEKIALVMVIDPDLDV